MTVDGTRNAVEEVEAARVPMGADNPYGNAFRRQVTRLTTESEAQRVADAVDGRVWHVVNPEQAPTRSASPSATCCTPKATRRCSPTTTRRSRARRVRHQAPVGHAVRPGRALPGGRLRQPAPGRRRAAGLGGGRPRRRRRGHRAVAHVRAHALPAHRGLADHAGRLHRLHAQAVGFFDRNPALDVPATEAKHCHG